MKLTARTNFVVILIAAAATALIGLSSQQPATAHPTIDITASNWQFTPAKITVPLGEPTTLRVIATTGVHGIKSDELGLPATTITPGTSKTVTFTPKKAGIYKVYCSVFCGTGHPNMYLTIEVK